jgi:type IV secretory pathway VirB10-like protein
MTASQSNANDEAGPTPATITAIRAAPPKPRRLSRKTLMAGALGLGALIAFALINGLSERDRTPSPGEDASQSLQIANPPENIREAPANYDLANLQPPEEGRDYFWGDHAPADAALAAADDAGPATYEPARPSPLETEADAARISSILFSDRRVAGPANAQSFSESGRRAQFVNGQRGRDDGVLDAAYAPPRSPYTIQAGATISAALITALNSDQPGRVIAQVSENVFDSVTGETLLIPQGARLIGTYDADTAYGERRLLVVWNRLIMPNGWSIPLRAMPGADAAGSAGIAGDVDAHIGRIVVASLISAVLGVAANESEDEDDGARLSQSIGDAAAQQAAQTGSRIVDRELNVRPTLRVRAGARVRVLVSQDIQLRPYPP